MNQLKLTVYGPVYGTDHAPRLVILLNPDIERKLNLHMAGGTVRQLKNKRFTWDKILPIVELLETNDEFVAFTAQTPTAPAELTWEISEEVDVESTIEYFLYSTGSTTLALTARALIWIADGSVWLSKMSEIGSAKLKEKAEALR